MYTAVPRHSYPVVRVGSGRSSPCANVGAKARPPSMRDDVTVFTTGIIVALALRLRITPDRTEMQCAQHPHRQHVHHRINAIENGLVAPVHVLRDWNLDQLASLRFQATESQPTNK